MNGECRVRKNEYILIYEYFLSKIGKLEKEYTTIVHNMRTKSFKFCDEVDFLELMLLKRELDFTITIFNELKRLLKL